MTNAYERSRLIEKRFQKALALIRKKRLNSGQLALELGVSPQPRNEYYGTEKARLFYSFRPEEDGLSYESNGGPPSKSSVRSTSKNQS